MKVLVITGSAHGKGTSALMAERAIWRRFQIGFIKIIETIS